MTAKDLKNALLQEAVQGKLVPQIASEGNARDLLKEIRKERLSHGFANSYGICDGKNKKSKSSDLRSKSQIRVTKKELPEITEDEIPFEIPESWCWCRLGELGLYRKGPFGSSLTKSMFVPKSDDSIKVYEQKNAIKKDFSLGEYYISKKKFETMQSFIVEPSDIIVSCAGTIGEVYKLPPEAPIGIINQALMRVKLFNDNLSSFWMMYFDYVLKKEASKQGSGTAIKNIPPFEILKAYPFPLPPLAEQKRIVVAIEKFMPLIEEYGKKESALKAINEQIGALIKKAILQEAVRGKLVPQIAAEGNAKDLLEEIKKEKTKLIKEGKIKKEKPLAEISEDETPFDIPENWCWCRLGEISTNITAGGDKPSHFSKTITEKLTVPVISNGEKDDGVFGYTDRATVTEKAITVSGRGNIGFTKVRSEPFMPIVRLITITFPNILDFKYLEIAISFLVTDGNGSAVQQLTVPMIKPLLIPLPPLAEQKRIVAAIEKILPLCEKLGE